MLCSQNNTIKSDNQYFFENLLNFFLDICISLVILFIYTQLEKNIDNSDDVKRRTVKYYRIRFICLRK